MLKFIWINPSRTYKAKLMSCKPKWFFYMFLYWPTVKNAKGPEVGLTSSIKIIKFHNYYQGLFTVFRQRKRYHHISLNYFSYFSQEVFVVLPTNKPCMQVFRHDLHRNIIFQTNRQADSGSSRKQHKSSVTVKWGKPILSYL